MRGSCLCGAVAYEADAPGLAMGHCSCRTCRKAHAAPFPTTGRVPRDKFKWLSGAEKLSVFRSGEWCSRRADRHREVGLRRGFAFGPTRMSGP